MVAEDVVASISMEQQRDLMQEGASRGAVNGQVARKSVWGFDGYYTRVRLSVNIGREKGPDLDG